METKDCNLNQIGTQFWCSAFVTERSAGRDSLQYIQQPKGITLPSDVVEESLRWVSKTGVDEQSYFNTVGISVPQGQKEFVQHNTTMHPFKGFFADNHPKILTPHMVQSFPRLHRQNGLAPLALIHAFLANTPTHRMLHEAIQLQTHPKPNGQLPIFPMVALLTPDGGDSFITIQTRNNLPDNRTPQNIATEAYQLDEQILANVSGDPNDPNDISNWSTASNYFQSIGIHLYHSTQPTPQHGEEKSTFF